MTRYVSIVGPTASGKSALAEALYDAQPNFELVSIDSIACYRHLDIGTAKPSATERVRYPWHGLDLVEPSEEFSVAEFQKATNQAIAGIEQAGHDVLAVGGTGLYHRAVIDDLSIPARYGDIATDLESKADEEGGLEQLYQRLTAIDPLGASRIEPGNRRRIVRALEVCLGSGQPFSSFGPGLGAYHSTRYDVVGLCWEMSELDRRIKARLARQFEEGFLEEVVALVGSGIGLSRTAAQALGYRELLAHLSGEMSLEQAKAEIFLRSKRFARRQMSWFRRDPRVHWLDAASTDVLGQVIAHLATRPVAQVSRAKMTR